MIHSVNTHHSCARISVVICILLGGLLIGSLTARAVQVGNDEVVFEQVRYDFPSPGQSTWYWTVTSGDQPAISHVTFELKLSCLNVDDAGTWTDFDTLNSGDGDPVIGTDPQTGDLTGVKFDEAFSGGESRGYYITVDGNYAQDSITFASKAGASFDTGEVTGPSLTCESVNGGGGSDTDSDGISDTEEGSGDRDGD